MGNHRRIWYDGLAQDIHFEVSFDSEKPWMHKVETREIISTDFKEVTV